MNKRLIAAVLAVFMLLAMTACNKTEEVQATTAENTTEAGTETIVSETVDPIDAEDGVKETEAEVNKATVITDSDKENGEETTEATDATVVPEETIEETEAVIVEVDIPVQGITEYEKFLEMSGAEQKAYMESFDSVDAFVAWLEAAKAEYEALHPEIEISGDPIDGSVIVEEYN